MEAYLFAAELHFRIVGQLVQNRPSYCTPMTGELRVATSKSCLLYSDWDYLLRAG